MRSEGKGKGGGRPVGVAPGGGSTRYSCERCALVFSTTMEWPGPPNHGLKIEGKRATHSRTGTCRWLLCTGGCPIGTACACQVRPPWLEPPPMA